MGLLAATPLLVMISLTVSLDNGLLKTPPMGWMAWERFRCDIDCKDDPENCIGETLFRDMADRLAEDGWKELGYEYVIIDDCWMSMLRDELGRLQPEPSRLVSFSHFAKSACLCSINSHYCAIICLKSNTVETFSFTHLNCPNGPLEYYYDTGNYKVYDVFTGSTMKVLNATTEFSVSINPSGVVMWYVYTEQQSKQMEILHYQQKKASPFTLHKAKPGHHTVL
ncbi:alpha-N-acetylgalactosaminidase-like [Perca fluviatilis]|uniref:alpha-N-acetylgalactosaminidase-like n=1 Tax=Perca fluviatilis TaxID=8168 RepID=UPI0019630292|nr:alpha-N-acetylgalactosaminidase-like [Perca fluviatilis]